MTLIVGREKYEHTEIILTFIAIGVWLIWYELWHGIEKRKENMISARRLSRKWREESKTKWSEFIEARKDEKSWEAYLKKQTPIKNEQKDE